MLRLQSLESVLDVAPGAVLELGDPDITEARLEHGLVDAGNLDDCSDELEVDGLVGALTAHAQLDLRAGFAAHRIDRRHERVGFHRHAVDGHYDVAREHPGAFSRRVVQRRDHANHAFGNAHLDADSAERTGGRFLKIVIVGLREIGAVRIERFEHASDRALEERSIVHVLDVCGANPVHHLHEGAQVFQRQHGGRRCECRLIARSGRAT